MERTKAPRFVFYPRPTPRHHPNPAAKTIRYPIDYDDRGIPDRAVINDLLPVAIIVQVGISGNAMAYIVA
jgi:hypothetical protein